VGGVYEQIRQAGGDVLAVSFSPPERVAEFLQRTPLPFRLWSDPGGSAYRAFGLGRATWLTFFRLAVLGRYLRLMARGWRVERQAPGDDLLQLGGDFVTDAAGQVVFARPSRVPTDRPTAAELLDAVRRASAADPAR
jgi:hypothetical protein